MLCKTQLLLNAEETNSIKMDSKNGLDKFTEEGTMKSYKTQLSGYNLHIGKSLTCCFSEAGIVYHKRISLYSSVYYTLS